MNKTCDSHVTCRNPNGTRKQITLRVSVKVASMSDPGMDDTFRRGSTNKHETPTSERLINSDSANANASLRLAALNHQDAIAKREKASIITVATNINRTDQLSPPRGTQNALSKTRIVIKYAVTNSIIRR